MQRAATDIMADKRSDVRLSTSPVRVSFRGILLSWSCPRNNDRDERLSWVKTIVLLGQIPILSQLLHVEFH